MNAKEELLNHIGDHPVEYIRVCYQPDFTTPGTLIEGSLDEVCPRLDFEYDESYGSQELFGTVWYTDGSWSDRREYDGSEWWEHRVRPAIPPKGTPFE